MEIARLQRTTDSSWCSEKNKLCEMMLKIKLLFNFDAGGSEHNIALRYIVAF